MRKTSGLNKTPSRLGQRHVSPRKWGHTRRAYRRQPLVSGCSLHPAVCAHPRSVLRDPPSPPSGLQRDMPRPAPTLSARTLDPDAAAAACAACAAGSSTEGLRSTGLPATLRMMACILPIATPQHVYISCPRVQPRRPPTSARLDHLSRPPSSRAAPRCVRQQPQGALPRPCHVPACRYTLRAQPASPGPRL